MAMNSAFSPLAARIGCDVPTLLERIAASEDVCAYIAHKLTLEIALPAEEEHLLTPPAPISPLHCRLYINADIAVCRYPEPHVKLISTLKALGWEWRANARAWAHMGGRMGPALDRMIEAGCALLAAGFILSVPNAEVARRIETGDFAPPQTHWIAMLTEGTHTGWFYITWGKNEDMYHAAMRIHGARYSRPGVACPPEAFDEVGDFAQLYGYSLTEGAIKLCETAKARAWEASVIEAPAVRQRTRLTPAKRHEKPQQLPDIDAQEIDDDLADRN